MACASVPEDCSGEVIGMRRSSEKSLRMSGTLVLGAMMLEAVSVWH